MSVCHYSSDMSKLAKYVFLQFASISPANCILQLSPSLLKAYSIAPIPLKQVPSLIVLLEKAKERSVNGTPVVSMFSAEFCMGLINRILQMCLIYTIGEEVL